MPPSVNQVLRERRAVWRALKRSLKAVDTKLEEIERLQNRVLARKRKAPEFDDLQKVISLSRQLDQLLVSYAKILVDGYPA